LKCSFTIVMSEKRNERFNVDELLKNLFPKETLNVLFEKRIKELDLTPTTALELLGIEYRALNGILNGTSKRVDYTNFIKLASFLKIPREKVFLLYLNELEKNFPTNEIYPKEKIEFLNTHFDLAALKKANFINSLTDYQHIEDRLKSFLDMEDILDYRLPSNHVAFSAGKVVPKDVNTRGLWINAAKKVFLGLANPNKYDKQALLQYFPKIRLQSRDVDQGLLNVIKDLYRLGVTVLYQAPLPSLHLRGATLKCAGQPCIILTDYRGFYSTLWFALIHELFHVVFDFEEIANDTYHISDEEAENLTLADKEKEADSFAREFLFSREKTEKIRPHLSNQGYVEDFASLHGIHPSFVYTFCAFDEGSGNQRAWVKARKFNPDFSELVKPIENRWDNPRSTTEFVEILKDNIFI